MFLKTIVEEFGFAPKNEELRPDVFGSAWIIYESQPVELRLVWDGKDGVGFLETRSHPTDGWRIISDHITENDLEGVPKNERKIDEFRRTIQIFADPCSRK